VGLSHRTVVACGEADGRRLALEAEDLPGWEAGGIDYMTWVGRGHDRQPSVEVHEAQPGEIATLRGKLIREGLPAEKADPELPGQLIEFSDRFGKIATDRWLVAPGDAPVAACHLLASGEIGQIEDVATCSPPAIEASAKR